MKRQFPPIIIVDNKKHHIIIMLVITKINSIVMTEKQISSLQNLLL